MSGFGQCRGDATLARASPNIGIGMFAHYASRIVAGHSDVRIWPVPRRHQSCASSAEHRNVRPLAMQILVEHLLGMSGLRLTNFQFSALPLLQVTTPSPRGISITGETVHLPPSASRRTRKNCLSRASGRRRLPCAGRENFP